MKAIGIVAALSALLTAGNAFAQASYPDKPLRILVGFVAGGPADVVARMVGDKLIEAWGKPVVIENVTGSGGNMATERVAKAAPDGYTLLLGTSGPFVIHPKPLPEAAVRSGKGFRADHAALLHCQRSSRQQRCPGEERGRAHRARARRARQAHLWLRRRRHHPASLRRAVQDHGRPRHPACPLPRHRGGDAGPARRSPDHGVRQSRLGAAARARRQGAPARGHLAHARAVIARPADHGGSGLPGFDATAWFGLLAPAGTPEPIIAKLHREAVRILALPDVRKRFDELGMVPMGTSPAQFAAAMGAEAPFWAKVIRASGAKLVD